MIVLVWRGDFLFSHQVYNMFIIAFQTVIQFVLRFTVESDVWSWLSPVRYSVFFFICFLARKELLMKMPYSVKLKHMRAAFLSNKRLLVLVQSQDVRSCTLSYNVKNGSGNQSTVWLHLCMWCANCVHYACVHTHTPHATTLPTMKVFFFLKWEFSQIFILVVCPIN